jgi:hypothetical protein
METISGRKTIQVSQWKKQFLDGASELFTSGKKSKDKKESRAKEAELFKQIGWLRMELEWLRKTLNCSEARELLGLVDHDHPEPSLSRQWALLGLPQSTLSDPPTPVRDSTLRIMATIDALYLDPIRALSLRGECQHGHCGGSGMGHRHHLHPAAERLPRPGDDRGSFLQHVFLSGCSGGWRWKAAASQGSSTPTNAVSSTLVTLWPGCGLGRSRSADLEGSAPTTTSWSRGCGAPSST